MTSPTGKKYIGQSVDIQARLRIYRAVLCKAQICLYHSLRKYGFEKHGFNILLLCEISDLNYYEASCIRHFKTLVPDGLNLTTGGDSTSLSAETRNKIRLSNTGKPSIYKGVKNRYTPETLEKMRNVKLGKTVSAATRQKISDTKKGRISNRKGVILSSEAKKHMSDARFAYLRRRKGVAEK